MKSRITMWTIAAFFAVLAMPICMAGQDSSVPSHPRHHSYRLIDLGTFGGPQGFINHLGIDGPDGSGPMINGQGVVVGTAQTNVMNTSCGGTNVYHALKYQKGMTTDLSALSPADDNCSNALSINAKGDVAGESQNGIIDPLLGVTEIRAVLWRGGAITDLGTFGGNASQSLAMNNRGEVVGFALNDIPDPYSIYGVFNFGSSNSTQTRGFLWRNGTMQDLGTLGGPDTYSGLLNERGQVAGNSYTNSIPNPATGVPTVDPFLWDRGQIKDLGGFGGVFGFANGINNRGQVVGFSDLPGDLVFHPFFWDGRVLKDLGTFGGSTGQAEALNDAGEVVGLADFAGDQLHDGFRWRNGVMTDLGNLGLTSHAYSINSNGQIVGNSRLADGMTVHAFLWENGQIADLNDLVSPSSDVMLVDVTYIADNGKIAVNGLPSGCTDQFVCGHPYLLVPNGDCDGSCEQRLANHERERAAAAQLARERGAMPPPDPVLTPSERVRNMMRVRHYLPGQPAVPRD